MRTINLIAGDIRRTEMVLRDIIAAQHNLTDALDQQAKKLELLKNEMAEASTEHYPELSPVKIFGIAEAGA